MRKAATVLLALALTGGRDLPAAQRSSSTGGFWYAVGVAPGWTRVSCQICAGSRRTGLSAFVGLGGRTSRALRIGGELGGWRKSDEGVTQTLMSIGAAAYWYPGTTRRVYLR